MNIIDIEKILDHTLFLKSLDCITEGTISNFATLIVKNHVKCSFNCKIIYMYDVDNTIWTLCTFTDYVEFLHKRLNNIYMYYLKKIIDSKDEILINNVIKLLYKISIKTMCYNIAKFNICECVDQDFIDTKVDQAINLIPIKNNKVVDLITGKVRERKINDYFTFYINASVDNSENVDNSLIVKTIKQIMNDSPEKIEMFQRIIGYSLTGMSRDNKLFLLQGDGSNGKTLLMNVIKNLVGNFYTTDIKNSKKRFIVVHDTTLKSVLRDIEHSLSNIFYIINGNFKNNISSKNKVFIKFDVTFCDNPVDPNQVLINPNLYDELTKPEQLDALLKWMVDGAVAYNANKDINL